MRISRSGVLNNIQTASIHEIDYVVITETSKSIIWHLPRSILQSLYKFWAIRMRRRAI